MIALLPACTQDGGRPPAKIERAQAVPASAGARTPESFCDKSHAPGAGPFFDLPPATDLATGRAGRITGTGRWTWVNIWATFCVPCVREMPALVKWREQIEASGTPLDLKFLSVDEEDAPVKSFLRRTPSVAAHASYRAGEHAPLEAAIKPLGLGSLDTIPMHILVAPDGRVRCARAGALNDDDFALVRGLVRSP